MPIVCLTGCSAVGKSTTARLLQKQFGAIHVPDVNELFVRPKAEEPTWYYERQLERYQIAKEHQSKGGLVVLDEDVFLPIWYNVYFPQPSFMPYAKVLDFYRYHLEQTSLAWPDVYIFLTATKEQIRERKMNDPAHRRGNFENHIAGLHLLEEYFYQLEQISPQLVVWHSAESPEGNAEAVIRVTKHLKPIHDQLEVFKKITSWLQTTKGS